MHALLVGSEHLRALAAVFHDELLTVAAAASSGNVGVVHARFWIACRQQFMGTAVAVDAGGRVAVSALDGFRVETALISGLLVGMAGRACDFLRWCVVRGTLNVTVAIHAGEHAAMDRIFEGLRIDVQTSRLAVDFMSQRGVTMAGESLVGSGFRRIFGRSAGAAGR